ncbi:LpqN/LpqT family lipoprotein [Mycolicibacterium sphagni]|uniref:LpqN/LpqT family lipoprotein n=1 Tax=Mycolicibacterium sphagni TaxID=1786 RepID=UPI0021F2ED21|nr:hypothetical protein [Mycolicibacterium sphagni]MCV7179926.1 hypothetical protein [Mycolicibacterium sphagni]
MSDKTTPTRFDEFVKRHNVSAIPADRFPGFTVKVGLPAGWVLLESAPGIRIWVDVNDPDIERFCTNAVLTMHRVKASLDASEVFAMLVNQQVQSIPVYRETQREINLTMDGAGVAGMLVLEVADDLGPVRTLCRSEIATTTDETLVAQLTVTAMRDSPSNLKGIWLSMGVASRRVGGTPTSAPIGGGRDGT